MNDALSDPVDDKELAALTARYGPLVQQHHRISMQRESLDNYRRQLARRRGEILLVLCRPTGEVLLHTKHFYPPGVYRLLTGGIDHGEPVADAWHRELWEETQLRASGERLLGVVSYEFFGEGRSVPFVSYIFQLDGILAEPVPLDESEGISGFRWIPRAGLAEVAAQLNGLDRVSPETGDWGRFRAIAHEFVCAAT